MEDWRSADIKCPFYKSSSSSKRVISCEGIADRSTVNIRFSMRDDMESYVDSHCAQFRSSCAIRRALNEKYEALE